MVDISVRTIFVAMWVNVVKAQLTGKLLQDLLLTIIAKEEAMNRTFFLLNMKIYK